MKNSESNKDAAAGCMKRFVRRGWRTFFCDECGHRYEAATRDAMSPSGDTCPECNEANFPTEHRIDAELPCDASGNLRGYPINVFPTNVKVHTPLPASASDETGVKP
jgi:hypothetical protein